MPQILPVGEIIKGVGPDPTMKSFVSLCILFRRTSRVFWSGSYVSVFVQGHSDHLLRLKVFPRAEGGRVPITEGSLAPRGAEVNYRLRSNASRCRPLDTPPSSKAPARAVYRAAVQVSCFVF